MTNGYSGTRIYRGESLDELLPTITDELGTDAVITRQREGVVGGVGGFFGKKCVEVEARSASRPPAVPKNVILDSYDLGGDAALADEPEERSVSPDPFAAPAPAPAQPQAEERPFDLELQDAAAAIARPQAWPPRVEPQPAQEQPAEELPKGKVFEGVEVGRALVGAGLAPEPVAALLGSVLTHVDPFATGRPLVQQVRSTLAQQLEVSYGWTGERHVLALIGTAGAGRTHAAAALGRTYARAGLSTAVLSVEPARQALALGNLLGDEVAFDIAQGAAEVEHALARLAGHGLIVVDTPALNPANADSIAAVKRMLESVRPDDVHLLVPGGTTAEAASSLAAALALHVSFSRVMLTKLDADPRVGGAVGLSIGSGRPFSYVMENRDLRPADPLELADLVLR